MLKVKRILKSFRYAARGLVKTFREEHNLRIQGVIGLIALILAWHFGISRFEWLFLIFAIGLVLLMEIINSAIERVADVLKPRIDTYVKEIKDIMAAAVMLSSLVAIVLGLVIFLPHFLNL